MYLKKKINKKYRAPLFYLKINNLVEECSYRNNSIASLIVDWLIISFFYTDLLICCNSLGPLDLLLILIARVAKNIAQAQSVLPN